MDDIKYYYSHSSGTVDGFYNTRDNTTIPDGAVECTVEERDAAINAAMSGKILCVTSGKITPQNPPQEPSIWDDGKWIVDTAAQAVKTNAIITAQIDDIDAQLNALDLKSIRSRGEIMDGTDTDGKAAAQLAKYKSQIAELRAQRATLTASLKSV